MPAVMTQPDKVVKCACGLPMRQKDWADHWRSCHKGSSVPATDQDVANLLAHEERRANDAKEHEAWLEARRKGRVEP